MQTCPSSSPATVAAAELSAALATLMDQPAFHKGVWRHLTTADRRRLYALRQQALYGDAPDVSSYQSAGTLSVQALSSGSRAGSSENTGTGSSSTSTRAYISAIVDVNTPKWYDVAGKARWNRWAALRGTMTPSVAAELFCAEMLALIEKHKAMALVPAVEAAIYRAERVHKSSASGAATATSTSQRSRSWESGDVFCVESLQGDPASLALMWICRTYGIPYELTLIPPSSVVTSPLARDGLDAFALHAAVVRPSSTASRRESVKAGAGKAHATRGLRLEIVAEVSDPSSAFTLLTGHFLPDLSHWEGVEGKEREEVRTADVAASEYKTSADVMRQRALWLDSLMRVTRHLRNPIMTLITDVSTSAFSSSHSSATTTVNKGPVGKKAIETTAISHEKKLAHRDAVLKTVSAHLHRFEGEFVRQERLQALRWRRQQQSSYLTERAAALALVQHRFDLQRHLVSAVDMYIASCGYMLCTHPSTQDAFPLHRSVLSEKSDGDAAQSRPWGNGTVSTAYTVSGHSIHLAGVPERYNQLINRMVHGEGAVATASAAKRLVVASVTPEEGDRSSSNKNSTSPYTELCACAAAAEAVEQLITSRVLSCTADLTEDTESTRSAEPFCVLASILSLSWRVCSEQFSAGFPYLMLDSRRSAMWATLSLAGEGSDTSLAPEDLQHREAPGGGFRVQRVTRDIEKRASAEGSWEARMQGLWAKVGGLFLKPGSGTPAGKTRLDEEKGERIQTFRSEGRSREATSKL